MGSRHCPQPGALGSRTISAFARRPHGFPSPSCESGDPLTFNRLSSIACAAAGLDSATGPSFCADTAGRTESSAGDLAATERSLSQHRSVELTGLRESLRLLVPQAPFLPAPCGPRRSAVRAAVNRVSFYIVVPV